LLASALPLVSPDTGQDQAEYIKALEARASTIASVFLRQEQAVMVSYAVHIHVD
jgi:hypothetical protein